MKVARYKMLSHKKDTPSPQRFAELKGGVSRINWDGLTSLKYEVVKKTEEKLYTRITVKINEKEIMSIKGGSTSRKTLKSVKTRRRG